jgi:hypothetical protein
LARQGPGGWARATAHRRGQGSQHLRQGSLVILETAAPAPRLPAPAGVLIETSLQLLTGAKNTAFAGHFIVVVQTPEELRRKRSFSWTIATYSFCFARRQHNNLEEKQPSCADIKRIHSSPAARNKRPGQGRLGLRLSVLFRRRNEAHVRTSDIELNVKPTTRTPRRNRRQPQTTDASLAEALLNPFVCSASRSLARRERPSCLPLSVPPNRPRLVAFHGTRHG